MLPEMTIAGTLLICMICFFAVGLHNIMRKHKTEENKQPHAEVEHPSNVILAITGFGTMAYFIEVILYVILVFANLISTPILSFLHYDFPFTLYTQAAGIILT